MTARPKVWVAQLAARFWAEVGEPPPFPRDLRHAACWLPDLHVRDVPHLTTASAADHFAAFNIPCPRTREARPLHGCFGAYRGTGAILLDPADPGDERRFTFAHELAHFLREYRAARRTAVARFGTGVLDVLDGLRPPTVNERLAGVLHGSSVGGHTHFLDRDRWGRVVGEDAQAVEDDADRLAFELFAPFDAVNPDAAPSRAALAARLASAFGLPPAPATKYATLLLR